MIETDGTQYPVGTPIQIIINLFFQCLQQLLTVQITKLNSDRAEA